MALKTIFELADTTTADVQGGAFTAYQLSPVIWLREIVDAAAKQQYAVQFAYQTDVGKGNRDVVIPYRQIRMHSGSTSWGASAGEGATMNMTTMSNLCGVTLSPLDKNFAIYLSNRAIRTSALNLVKHAQEELTLVCGDGTDRAVMASLNSDANKAGSGTRGSQAIYGGDATQASEIAAGDVITTDMVAEAKRKLQSSICKYWTYGTSEANSTAEKNPWINESGSPFVLMIAPEQEEAFLTDSQFINASEYGGDQVISNGEIGKYLGIKIVVSNNVIAYGTSVTHADASTTAVAQHRCVMLKSQKAVGIAWGQKPRLAVVPFPSELEIRLIIEQAYATAQIQSDAIVHINVADE